MNRDDAERLDRRLTMALLTRMRTAEEPDALRDDLRRMHVLIERARSRPSDADEVLAEGHRRLAKHLPEGDPEREALEKEAERLERAQEERRKGHNRQTYQLPRPYDESRLTPEHLNEIRLDPERDWPLPPPFPGDWRDLDQEALVRMIVRAEAAYGSSIDIKIFLNLTAGRCTAVPCYPGFELVEFLWVRPDGEAEGLLFLLGKEVALWLTGTSPGIHALNKGTMGSDDGSASRASFLDISDATRAENYLRFFCAMVAGEGGPFHVISSATELERFWLEDAVPQSVSDIIAPLEIEKVELAPTSSLEEAVGAVIWRVETCVLYARVLFRSSFCIQRGGMIEMTDDDPLAAEEMPVLAERYEDGGRVAVRPEKRSRGDDRTSAVIDHEPAVPANHALAAKLMRDAAMFFSHIARENSELAPQMSENENVFLQVADLVESDPLGKIGEEPYPTHADLAASLLLDAAEFFTSIAGQNPEMSSQMTENADVFREVAALVRDDPTGNP
jgi:hypothetical protein